MTTKDVDPEVQQSRLRYAFIIAMVGLFTIVAIIFALLYVGWKTASDIVAVIGAITGIIGTLVGAFLGVQIGEAGKEKVQQDLKIERLNLNKAIDSLEQYNKPIADEIRRGRVL